MCWRQVLSREGRCSRRQAVLELHLGDQKCYCSLRCRLCKRLGEIYKYIYTYIYIYIYIYSSDTFVNVSCLQKNAINVIKFLGNVFRSSLASISTWFSFFFFFYFIVMKIFQMNIFETTPINVGDRLWLYNVLFNLQEASLLQIQDKYLVITVSITLPRNI